MFSYILSTQSGSTYDTGIVAERCNLNLSLLACNSGVLVNVNYRSKRLNKSVLLTRNTATDTNNFGLEDVNKISNSGCKVVYVVVYKLRSVSVALVLCCKCGARAYLALCLSTVGEQRA